MLRLADDRARATSGRLHRGAALLALATALMVPSACGDGDDSEDGEALDQVEETRTVGEGAEFGGRFEELPLVPRSEPIGSRSERDGFVTRSYAAEGASPARIMAFYESSLPALGWEVLVAPEPSGTSTIQAEWSSDELLLRITANEAAALGGDQNPTEAVTSQYSLIMSER